MHVRPSIGRCLPYDHKLGFEKKEKKIGFRVAAVKMKMEVWFQQGR